MENRVALVHCVHHKPWLIMSTLVSTMIQEFQDFDIFFLYNKGNGERYYERYKEFYDEYDILKRKFGKNTHLDDSFDERLIEVCKIKGKNIFEVTFEDDHGLDSGAWYKFIKSGLWKNYDYIFFLGEGTLLTGTSVLDELIKFSSEKGIHFITGSHEKRFISRSWLLNGFASGPNPTEMTKFNDRMISEVFNVFSRDSKFEEVMLSWNFEGDQPQEHHIPDIWGYFGIFIEKVIRIFPAFRLFQNHYFYFRNIFLVWLGNLSLYSKSNKYQNSERVYVNRRMRDLGSVINFEKYGNSKFHKPKEIGWFGCHCNHFVSNQLLERLDRKLDKYEIYDAMKLPYSAGPLEPIWGLIPVWLGYDIWFFDGIHRVRKNFVTYVREDDQPGMARYLNRYFKGILSIRPDGDNIKIHTFLKSYKDRLSGLNKLYFLKRFKG